MVSQYCTPVVPVGTTLKSADGATPSLPEVLRYVDDCDRRCRGALGAAIVVAYEAGTMLLGYREQFQHGQWETEVRRIVTEEGLGITLRTCQRYMQVGSILGELLLEEMGQGRMEDQKTTRATLLRILRQRDLLSINKLLAVTKSTKRKSKGRGSEADATATADTTKVHENNFLLTPPAILSAVSDFFRLGIVDNIASLKPDHPNLAVLALGLDNDDLATLRVTGNFFVHPQRDDILPQVEETIAGIASGEIQQAIMLVPAVMDAVYSGPLQPYVKAFLRERPVFPTQGAELVVPPTPFMLVLVTREPEPLDRFADAFGHLCDIYYPHRF